MIQILGSLGTVITAITPRTSEAFGKDMHRPALHELVAAEPIGNLPIHSLAPLLASFWPSPENDFVFIGADQASITD